jgi:hypothetical protein
MDKWDGNFPTDESATLTLNPAIVGLQEYGTWTQYPFVSVRATHTDLAGNESTQVGNNFIPGTVDAPEDYSGAGLTGLYFGAPTAAVELCNGQGASACDDDTQETSVTAEWIAEGPAGSFANPFLTGTVYFYAFDGVDFELLGSVDASSAVITDEGIGGNRYYTWSFDVTSEMAARYPDGTNLAIWAMGVKNSMGTGLYAPTMNGNITVVDGTL